MAKLLEYDNDKCTQCHQCELACAKAFFKEENVLKSCIQVSEEKGINVCNQCGECMKACPEEALTMNKNGVVTLNKKRCVGCLICVGFCPNLSMRYAEGELIPFKCIACGICAKQCPADAISVVEEVATCQ